MNTETLLQMIEELQLQETIEQYAIPNLDLYMDQVITLFEEKLGHTKRYEEDKLLTKTMINNYIKDKVLMPAVKKKYTKEHILLMIMLYDLKQVLAIGDIKRLFGTIVKEDNVDAQILSEIYQIFIDLKKDELKEFKEEVNQIEKSITAKTEVLHLQGINEEELKSMLQVIILTEKANYYKRLAEKIIDEKISDKK